MSQPHDDTPARGGGAPLTRRNIQFSLGMLTIAYALNFIDRQILVIVQSPIKAEMGLSDMQLGLLSGFSFAMVYVTAGIPIAYWADRGNRRNIISLAIGVWSGMTALSGFAQSYTQLVLARIGVGIGEAGCSPPIHSLIADLYPERKRATALSIYSLGIPIGGALGTLIGGWVGEYFGWRMAFLVVGFPGILIALIFFLTIKEPPRGYSEPGGIPARKKEVPLKETLQFMWKLNSFRHMSFAGSLHAFVGYGVALFLPSFFMRVHGFGLAETSTYLFFIGLTGVIGTYLGGYLSDRLGVKDRRWYLWVPGIATMISVPFAALFYTTGDPYLAVLLAIPGAILGPMYLGPTFAMTQTLSPLVMRSLASAILLFILNLIGLGLGPLFAGFLSDLWRPEFGEESIRYSLLTLAVAGNFWSAFHYYLGSRTLRSDLKAKEAFDS